MAQEFREFSQAREAYQARDYPLAVERFEALVGGELPRLSNPVYVVESRKYLGASYLFVGREEDAARQFELLLRQEESYELDPVSLPQEVLDLFSAVRERLQVEREREARTREQGEVERRRAEAARILREGERLSRLEELARTQVVERPNSRLVATLPFGIGQFQNGHDGVGLALALTESLLAVVSLGSKVWHMSLPAKVNAEVAQAGETLMVVNWIATGAFAAVAIAGVLDAHARFVPIVRETRMRELPPELELSVGPTGGSLRLRF